MPAVPKAAAPPNPWELALAPGGALAKMGYAKQVNPMQALEKYATDARTAADALIRESQAKAYAAANPVAPDFTDKVIREAMFGQTLPLGRRTRSNSFLGNPVASYGAPPPKLGG